jgi:ankyrin repeat protein
MRRVSVIVWALFSVFLGYPMPSVLADDASAKSKVPVDEDAVPDRKEWRLFSKLLTAVDRGDLKAVKGLIKKGADVNGRKAGDDFAPRTRPLSRAARRGDENMVAVLLRAGADPNWCCCSCVTPLHEAILGKNPKVVRRILDAGGDPSILFDGSDETLQLAKQSGDAEIVELVQRRLAGR